LALLQVILRSFDRKLFNFNYNVILLKNAFPKPLCIADEVSPQVFWDEILSAL